MRIFLSTIGLSILCLVWIVCTARGESSGEAPGSTLTPKQQELLKEHVFGGVPETGTLIIRNGYVLSFDGPRRVPKWVAYHIEPEYLDTPKRKGRFSTFRADPDLTTEAKSKDYTGLFATRGFARGHLAPYAVMGGDRDDDGMDAAAGDDDDIQTVFQAMRMSNIAPQHHAAFNGSGGMWFNLERWTQDLVKSTKTEAWVFAGCIFGPSVMEKVGPNKDIEVPPIFYKIVIRQDPDDDSPYILAFLFPHHRSRHGSIEDYLVSVDVIEALTGLDFFQDLPDPIENALEDADSWEVWKAQFSK